MIFQENRLLSELCTFGIGGPARYFIEVRTIQEMSQAIVACSQKELPFFILGKGSNCLFDDQGFNGTIIHNKIDFFESPQPGLFHVGAGYSFSLLGVQTARQGWSGLEFASGIPASVGGAVFMNAGANGAETADSLCCVDFVNEKGVLQTLLKEELHFAYRTSSFHQMKGAIVGATFRLISQSEARKKQLDIVHYRMKTQPYSEKSAGCVFRNPPTGFAGALIEQQGLKGCAIGGAQVSTMHANFIINDGTATANDVKNLISHVKTKIKEKTGVDLKLEVRCIPHEVSK